MGHDGIAIGELSRRTGCNIETVRYYERIGLLPTPARRGRYRTYGTEDVGRLAFVRRARLRLVVALPEPNLDAVHPQVDPFDQQLDDPRLLGR